MSSPLTLNIKSLEPCQWSMTNMSGPSRIRTGLSPNIARGRGVAASVQCEKPKRVGRVSVGVIYKDLIITAAKPEGVMNGVCLLSRTLLSGCPMDYPIPTYIGFQTGHPDRRVLVHIFVSVLCLPFQPHVPPIAPSIQIVSVSARTSSSASSGQGPQSHTSHQRHQAPNNAGPEDTSWTGRQ